MSRWHKFLIAVFSIGVLICGLGAGVWFMEFSSLTYGGKQIIGKTDMKTENIDVPFEPAQEECIVHGQWGWRQTEIETDSKVPVNHVRFRVTYNAERVTPYAAFNEEEKEFSFLCRWFGGEEDEVALIMEAKDLVLENLMKKRLVSFDTVGIEEVTVWVNPENKEDVRLIY